MIERVLPIISSCWSGHAAVFQHTDTATVSTPHLGFPARCYSHVRETARKFILTHMSTSWLSDAHAIIILAYCTHHNTDRMREIRVNVGPL